MLLAGSQSSWNLPESQLSVRWVMFQQGSHHLPGNTGPESEGWGMPMKGWWVEELRMPESGLGAQGPPLFQTGSSHGMAAKFSRSPQPLHSNLRPGEELYFVSLCACQKIKHVKKCSLSRHVPFSVHTCMYVSTYILKISRKALHFGIWSSILFSSHTMYPLGKDNQNSCKWRGRMGMVTSLKRFDGDPGLRVFLSLFIHII